MTETAKAAKIDNGGSAFPHANPSYDGNWNKERQIAGMTLRDWFAGQAREEDAARHINWIRPEDAADGIGRWDCTYEAAKYRYADAMLAARKQEHQP